METVELAPAPADWLLLFDRSSTWNRRADRFAGLKDGIGLYLAGRSDAVAVAATSFPRAASCDVADYATPELSWMASANDVTAQLAAWGITGDSTLGPALAGAGHAARQRHWDAPGRSTSVIVLTDAAPGEDETCTTSDWNEVATIAGSLFAHGRGPNVHVVSVIGTAASPDHPAKLGGIAVAGGGYAAFVNGGQSDVARSTHTALLDLEARATTCTRTLPPGFVPERITVVSPDGTITEVARVADASACSGATFFLDHPLAPTTATLCSGTGGIGGFCEQTFLRARIAGAPTVTATGSL